MIAYADFMIDRNSQQLLSKLRIPMAYHGIGLIKLP